MLITWQMLLTLCPLIFLAGFVDSIAGGGGLISLPAYYLVGLPASMAAGTNKLSSVMGMGLATYRYAHSGRVDYRVGLCTGAGALLAGMAGALVMKQLNDHTIRVLVLCCLPLAAFVTLRGHWESKERRLLSPAATAAIALLIGLGIGFYDGLVGPGTGTFLILLFVHVFGMDDVTASATGKLPNLCSGIAALGSLLVTGDVMWQLGLPAGLMSMAGAALGSRLALRHGAKLVRAMMLIVFTLLLVKMITDVLQ